MRAVAEAAAVSRSTLYRHFGNSDELQRALQQETLARASSAIERSVSEQKPALAELRAVVSTLVTLGAEFPLEGPDGAPPDESLVDVGERLRPLCERLAGAAGLVPTPTGPWLSAGIADFVDACLCAGWSAPTDTLTTVERLLGVITEPLDRGLLLLDAEGSVVAVNPEGRAALGAAEPIDAGGRLVVRSGGMYEDGAAAPAHAHPVAAALASGDAAEGIRGHRSAEGRRALVLDRT